MSDNSRAKTGWSGHLKAGSHGAVFVPWVLFRVRVRPRQSYCECSCPTGTFFAAVNLGPNRMSAKGRTEKPTAQGRCRGYPLVSATYHCGSGSYRLPPSVHTANAQRKGGSCRYHTPRCLRHSYFHNSISPCNRYVFVLPPLKPRPSKSAIQIRGNCAANSTTW